jgi:hypothetical protein
MKVTLNSNLFPIINVGMYNSNISSENVFDDYTIIEDKNNGYIHYDVNYFWNNFQNDKYVKRIQELASEYLEGKIDNGNGIDITIKCKEIYSPKFYNFGTDEIVMDVTFNKTKVLQVVKKEREIFNQFLKDDYTSYDGFTSFTSNNYDDWLVDFQENEVRSIGAVLTYLFQDSITYNKSQFEFFVNEGVGNYWEYIDSTDYENEVVELKKYVKDNYLELTIDNIDFNQFGFEVLDNESCISIFKDVVNEIESNTMSMF